MRRIVGCLSRVYERNRPPAVEFSQQRGEMRVAEIAAIVVREEDKAVSLQLRRAVLDLVEGRVDVGQRQAGKRAEAPCVPGPQLRSVVIAFAQQGGRIRGPEETERIPSWIPFSSIIAMAPSADQLGAIPFGIASFRRFRPTSRT